MSTLSIAPAFTPARRTVEAGSGPVRLTRRGRVVVVLAFLALALVVMTALGGWATATRHAAQPAPVRVVTVAPGDTLYSIAGRYAEPGEVREMVLRIQQLNSLPGATIQPCSWLPCENSVSRDQMPGTVVSLYPGGGRSRSSE